MLNQEQLFSGTRFGQRVQQELDAASTALSAENREIEAELTAEELRLTEVRAQMSAEEFRPLADEFDARVEAIRAEQDAKARGLAVAADRAQTRFFDLIVPVLLEVVQQRGAAVIMDSRAVLLSAETVDITEVVIQRVDEVLGDGGEGPVLDLRPIPAPGSDGSAAQPGAGSGTALEVDGGTGEGAIEGTVSSP